MVGFDTAARVIQPRYYGDSEAAMLDALAEMRERRNRFLVAGREGNDGRFRELHELPIPEGFAGLFAAIPARLFRKRHVVDGDTGGAAGGSRKVTKPVSRRGAALTSGLQTQKQGIPLFSRSAIVDPVAHDDQPLGGRYVDVLSLVPFRREVIRAFRTFRPHHM